MKIKVRIDLNDDNSSLYSVTDWYNINVDPTNPNIDESKVLAFKRRVIK